MITINKFLFPVLLLSAVPILLPAQTLQKEEVKAGWMMLDGTKNTNADGHNGLSYEPAGDNSQSKIAIPLDNGLIVTLGSKGVIAVAGDATLKWDCDIKGIPLTVAKYKNSLIAISAPDRQKGTGLLSNTLDAFLIDPLTGKVLLTKTINTGDDKFVEQALFFPSVSGDFFKVGVRLTQRKKALDFTLYGKLIKQYAQTQSFTLFDLDEKLEKNTITNLILPEGGYGAAQANSKGEVFIRTIASQNAITVSQFLPGNAKPVKKLEQALISKSKDINTKFLVSKHDPSIVYLSTLYDGTSGATLTISSLNFTDGKVKDHTEVINKSLVKDLEKKYLVLNKDLRKPDLGSVDNMKLLDMEECGEQIFVSLSAIQRVVSGKVPYDDLYSLLLKGYDRSLKPTSQNIIPRFYNSAVGYGISMHKVDNAAHFIVNDHASTLSNRAIYGQLNLQSGEVSNLHYLKKDKIEKSNPVDINTVLWLPSGFLVTYLNIRGIGGSLGADFQLYSYK